MGQTNDEKFILLIETLAAAGVILEIILMGWELWVPCFVIIGVIILWGLNLTGSLSENGREFFYFMFAFSVLFYHGIHRTVFFDIGITSILVIATFSVFNKAYMLRLVLLEYFILLFAHIFNLTEGDPIIYDKFTIVRIFLHIAIVLLVFYISIRSVKNRIEDEEEKKIKEEVVKQNDSSMEDFLSNISHELRTPVNVVNGMSDLLIKRGVGSEADAIKNAGVRLAYQIEDIQDYTECRRGKVFLEEDNYMSTSLINDVVTSFRVSDNTEDLEMVVDLDPLTPYMMRGDIKKLHKIFRHLLENAVKFTKRGGIYVKMYTEKEDYGVNLCIEMTDTGMGMDRDAVRAVLGGLYQANKKRNRSSGGIGLGLFIVYGFTHRMGGFIKIESQKGTGTTVRVTIPQKVVDERPCLALEDDFKGALLFHVRPDKYKVPKLRDFYRSMASNLATGVHVPLYAAETTYEVENLKEKINATHVFMGEEEYKANSEYFEELTKEGIVVVVSASPGFKLPEGSRIVLMPKPLYAYPVIKILNNRSESMDAGFDGGSETPLFKGVKALIVDDEPMNLVVATSLFREYDMIIETAPSGREAIKKYRDNDYDVIFMDHMMPEMDGVEAMKLIKASARDLDREIKVIALTANAVSGAREMFIREGFDGFIAKPINTADFERTMLKILPSEKISYEGRCDK